MLDVVITTNSPGEVAAWVKPVVTALKKTNQDIRITVFVLPCTYATGREVEILQGFAEIDFVFAPSDYWRMVLSGRVQEHLRKASSGVVVHLGGDQTHTILIARKLRLPAVAYTEGFVNWAKKYHKFFVPDIKTKEKVLNKGVAPEKVETIGNLMLDAVSPSVSRDAFREKHGIAANELVLGIFPGSRRHEVSYMLPFFLKVAENLNIKMPGLHFFVALSPFVTFAQLEKYLACDDFTALEGVKGVLNTNNGLIEIITANGVKINLVRENQRYDLMNSIDTALTIPGTNTAELSFLGVPMLVVTPLNKPEEIPLDGIFGLIGNMPFIGKKLKKAAVLKAAERVKFTALPNRIVEREIVPEIKGIVDAEMIADRLADLLLDDGGREKMAADLKQCMGEVGAAERFTNALLEIAQGIDKK